jgi:hypothetical protein
MAWAGHDKEAKDAVAELRKVDPLHCADKGGVASVRRSNLQSAICALSRRPSQGGRAGGHGEGELSRRRAPA